MRSAIRHPYPVDVFDQFPVEPEGGPKYHRLVKFAQVDGPNGRYYRLTCQDDGEPEITATCDEAHREHLRPFLDLLVKSEQGLDCEMPLVPLFQGRDGKFRFSTFAAERDYPEIKDHRDISAPSNGSGVTRLQVSCPTSLATEFKKVALNRNMAHTDLLLKLVRDTVTSTG